MESCLEWIQEMASQLRWRQRPRGGSVLGAARRGEHGRIWAKFCMSRLEWMSPHSIYGTNWSSGGRMFQHAAQNTILFSHVLKYYCRIFSLYIYCTLLLAKVHAIFFLLKKHCTLLASAVKTALMLSWRTNYLYCLPRGQVTLSLALFHRGYRAMATPSIYVFNDLTTRDPWFRHNPANQESSSAN